MWSRLPYRFYRYKLLSPKKKKGFHVKVARPLVALMITNLSVITIVVICGKYSYLIQTKA